MRPIEHDPAAGVTCTDALTVRVVGRVYRRPTALAIVTTPNDAAEVRVQWEAPGAGKGRSGFRCGVHGRLEYSDDCIHGDLAEVAINHARQLEGNGGTNGK